jgi:hypothetical protein
MRKKSKKPSPVLWGTITLLFSAVLTGGTVYLFKSGALQRAVQKPATVVIDDAVATRQFNELMDVANAASATKDYLAAVTALDQVLALGDNNARVKQACVQQDLKARRDDFFAKAAVVLKAGTATAAQ